VRVRLWGDKAEMKFPNAKEYGTIAPGGWKNTFEKGRHWDGDYGGDGSRGGVPDHEADRGYQRHDLGWQRYGKLDADSDARLAFDSTKAALNPANGMSIGARTKAALAAGAASGVPFGMVPIGHKKIKRVPVDPGTKFFLASGTAAARGVANQVAGAPGDSAPRGSCGTSLAVLSIRPWAAAKKGELSKEGDGLPFSN
jgi:hypothetical protein